MAKNLKYTYTKNTYLHFDQFRLPHLKTIPTWGFPRLTPARRFRGNSITGRFWASVRTAESATVPGFHVFASCNVLARGWQEWWCAKSIKITERSPWFVWFCWIWVASSEEINVATLELIPLAPHGPTQNQPTSEASFLCPGGGHRGPSHD